MRIGYVAKHDSGGNDDEGAITYALEKLGHTVLRLQEARGYRADRLDCDFILFHKWSDTSAMKRCKVPLVFWYFDLVDFPDPTLAERCKKRREWMEHVMPCVHLGFCTDGDWVERDRTGKLVTLRQGADERVVGLGEREPGYKEAYDTLFTGIRAGGGSKRVSFVDEIQRTYGDRFYHVTKGVHGRELANLIASSKIVVAPDGPVTDRYWSNRVYNALGFGAFLLHPYCEELLKEYEGDGMLLYRTREQLHRMIANALAYPSDRKDIAGRGLKITQERFLYRHRCEELIRIVKERL